MESPRKFAARERAWDRVRASASPVFGARLDDVARMGQRVEHRRSHFAGCLRLSESGWVRTVDATRDHALQVERGVPLHHPLGGAEPGLREDDKHA